MKRIALVAGLALASPAFAQPPPAPTEEQRVAHAVEKALQKHGADVHRCFERALADRLDVAGPIIVAVEVGPGGKVKDAKVGKKGDSIPSPLADCVLTAARGWTVTDIEPGAVLELPFRFDGQANQFLVKAADVPERGPAAPKGRGGVAGQPAFRVKVLADSVNVRSQEVSVTLLTVGPANRVAMHRHPRSAKVLYVLDGRARLLGPTGSAPLTLAPGSAVFVPEGHPHVIENMGRQISVTMLQVFAPPGPEKVYREPQNPEARMDFEVIRDPKVKAPEGKKPVLVNAADVKALAAHGGKTSVKILFDEAATGSRALAFDVIEFAPNQDIPRHDHGSSAEVLYVLSGGGTVMVGSEPVAFGPEQLVFVPPGQPHSVKMGSEKTVAVQIYAPAGPEQRFKAPAAAPAPAKPASKETGAR